jgi:hypothetical protein
MTLISKISISRKSVYSGNKNLTGGLAKARAARGKKK